MLTIFSAPKPFIGHINTIQRNAIKSWLKLDGSVEVILLGDEEGIKETAFEFNIRHIKEIARNEYNVPLISSIFKSAEQFSSNRILAYVNCDIIFTKDIIEAVKKINHPVFLANGRRWDLDIKEEINFEKSDWDKELYKMIEDKGELHGYSGIDYFVFLKPFPFEIPDFAVGRPGWDNWLIYKAKSLKIPVIDLTEAVDIVHQNHNYAHSPFANEKKKRIEGAEFEKNIRLAGGLINMLTIREADWVLTKEGLKKPAFFRNILSKLSSFYFFRYLLYLKREIQNRL
ncbi:MAG: hypothetical protein PHI53_01500 [Candidatus Pacebacteria bacterium]|nr:hypothetical protein [Candidatus Paceibacterota bacterium]